MNRNLISDCIIHTASTLGISTELVYRHLAFSKQSNELKRILSSSPNDILEEGRVYFVQIAKRVDGVYTSYYLPLLYSKTTSTTMKFHYVSCKIVDDDLSLTELNQIHNLITKLKKTRSKSNKSYEILLELTRLFRELDIQLTLSTIVLTKSLSIPLSNGKDNCDDGSDILEMRGWNKKNCIVRKEWKLGWYFDLTGEFRLSRSELYMKPETTAPGMLLKVKYLFYPDKIEEDVFSYTSLFNSSCVDETRDFFLSLSL